MVDVLLDRLKYMSIKKQTDALLGGRDACGWSFYGQRTLLLLIVMEWRPVTCDILMDDCSMIMMINMMRWLQNFDSINILEDHQNVQHISSSHTLLAIAFHKIASWVKNGGCFVGSVEINKSKIKWFLFLDEMLVVNCEGMVFLDDTLLTSMLGRMNVLFGRRFVM